MAQEDTPVSDDDKKAFDRLTGQRNTVALYSLFLAIVTALGIAASYTWVFSADKEGKIAESPELVLTVFSLAALAGALGGVLYNLRGLVAHPVRSPHAQLTDQERLDKFDAAMLLTYYLQPWTGAVCGVLSLLAIQFFAGGIGLADGKVSFALFASPGSRLGIGALAILSGYATKEFLDKVKDLVKTLFASKNSSS